VSQTRVSCVIPVYNAEAFVAEAVTSVLEQTVRPQEIIVVDDGSTDGTPDALAAFGSDVHVIRQQNQGVSAARNVGVDAAEGEWIALLDADDWWLPEKLARQQALAADPDVGLVYTGCWAQEQDSGRRHETPLVKPSDDAYHRLLRGNFVPTSTVMVRRDLWQQAGGLEPMLATCEDWDLWIRLARVCRFACVPQRLCIYRLHGSGLAQGGVEQMRADERRVLERAFAADPDLADRARRRAWAGHHYRCGMDAYTAGDYRTARREFRDALARVWHGSAARRYVEALLRGRWRRRRRCR